MKLQVGEKEWGVGWREGRKINQVLKHTESQGNGSMNSCSVSSTLNPPSKFPR